MKAPENPALEAAMTQVVSQDSPQNRRRLYKELLRATLIVPMAEGGSKTKMELLIGEDEEGRTTLPAFTSVEAITNWSEQERKVASLPASELFRIAVDLKVGSVAINPAGPIGGQLMPGELRALADGEVPEGGASMVETITMSRLGPVRYQAPASPPPPEFVAGLREKAAGFPEIRRAFLFAVAIEGPAHLVVGVEFGRLLKADEAKAVFKELGSAVGPMMGTGEALDFMDLKAMGLLEEIARLVPPVYAKGAEQKG